MNQKAKFKFLDDLHLVNMVVHESWFPTPGPQPPPLFQQSSSPSGEPQSTSRKQPWPWLPLWPRNVHTNCTVICYGSIDIAGDPAGVQALEGGLVPFGEAGWGSWVLRTRFGEAWFWGQGEHWAQLHRYLSLWGGVGQRGCRPRCGCWAMAPLA